ncbi:MAG TPA: phage tail sheath C-terminal domain-containing protein [Bryobacteraceae bacterium]|jgi:hypothetical protein|nr:phage tail sheath C-terminal domain-containing protein [Bryobacteraceae bacterium]
MPPVLNYPGVYIEELPSAVHTITGVATSIGAFVGWAARGPVDEAALIFSFADFQTQFGGLDSRSLLGYSVNHFFANGGQQAYVIRLTDGTATRAKKTIQGVTFEAKNPGQWGGKLTVSVTPRLPVMVGKFSVLVNFPGPAGQLQPVENFVNLSSDSSDPRYVLTVINADSQYLNVTGVTGSVGAAESETLDPAIDGTVLNPGDGNFENAMNLSLALSPATPPPGTPGLPLLNRVDIFNLLCVPGETVATTVQGLSQYCWDKRAMYIVDSPEDATVSNMVTDGPVGTTTPATTLVPMAGAEHPENAAYYFPWVQAPDPLFGNRPKFFPPCGFVAGIYAATDASRGVWKAPAGIETGLTGVNGLETVLTDPENGAINVKAVNCLRQFKTFGNVVWGARTMQGADDFGSQWKYVPIRRTALYIESSLYNGTKWVVFEPNDETLWGQIRLNVGAFMQGLFLQGAFQGTTPQQAYFVKCDAENNPQPSIDLGIVNILVGFAPLYPAEFVVIQIQQMAGQ